MQNKSCSPGITLWNSPPTYIELQEWRFKVAKLYMGILLAKVVITSHTNKRKCQTYMLVFDNVALKAGWCDLRYLRRA